MAISLRCRRALRKLSVPGVVLLVCSCCFSEVYGVVVHNYLFNSGDGTTAVDSVGGANGTVIDGAIVTADSRLVLDGSTYVSLPASAIAINSFSEVTLEIWLTVSPSNANQYTWAYGFGRTADGTVGGEAVGFGYDYLMMMPTRGGPQGTWTAISPNTNDREIFVNAGEPEISDGLLHHVVTTVDDEEIGFFIDGQKIGTSPLAGSGTMDQVTLQDVSNELAFLGKSLYPDPVMKGAIYEFRIHDAALTESEVLSRYTNGCEGGCGDGPALEVDRDTGEVRLVNNLSDARIAYYDIASAGGALDPDGWRSIAEHGDSDSGATVDPDDIWSIGSSSATQISEQEPIGGGGPDNGAVLSESKPISLGGLWVRSPIEDLTATVTLLDEGLNETLLEVPVVFIGNGDQPLSKADFDVDGDVDIDDYQILLTQHLQELGGTLPIDTYDKGDIDGDLDNDYDDWWLFKQEYVAIHGEQAFSALVAHPLPEPTSAILAFLFFLGASWGGSRSHKAS